MRHIVIDTETTGMNPDRDGVVELAAVWRQSDDDWRTWSSLCNPGVSIGVEARAAHHLSDDDVRNAPSPTTALSKMLSDIGISSGDRVYVAHNARFDREFLAKLSESMGIVNRWICTWRCALHLWPEAPSHKNQVLRYWLGLSPDVPSELHPHRALYDAIVTESILRRMLESHSYEELIRLSTSPVLLTTVRFGKHEGSKWRDVPRDYLRWILRNGDFDEDVVHTARHWIES